MKDTVPLMGLSKQIHRDLKIEEVMPGREVKCEVFEDNNGHIELENCPKFYRHTNYVEIKHNHFRRNVGNGKVLLFSINTLEQ